jgi:hypothetical protein
VIGGTFVVGNVQKNITTEIWDIFFLLSAFTNNYFRGDTETSIDEQTLKSFPSISLSCFMHCFYSSRYTAPVFTLLKFINVYPPYVEIWVPWKVVPLCL